MKFKATTIVENTVLVSKGLIGEHGLSFLIETEDKKILFDTGQGTAIVNNMTKIGHSAKDIATAVLSHGHYDHTGGLRSLLGAGAQFELIAHPDVFSEKVAPYPGKGIIPIGIPITREELIKNGITMRLERDSTQIAPGITTTGEIPMKTDFEKIEPVLLVRENGKEKPDPLADDQALILDTENGIVVLLGCAHRGVVNTLNRAAEITGKTKIHAIMGGLHLERAPEAQIEKTIAALREFDPKTIGFAHCTGIRAAIPLINAFGNRVFQSSVGMVANF
ncbi:MAG: MBL fold metallo-hydrolase [bacterium]